MTLLNQIDTGQPVPNERRILTGQLLEAAKQARGSFFTHVQVHCWELAKVLDRLEVLEDFVKDAKLFVAQQAEYLVEV